MLAFEESILFDEKNYLIEKFNNHWFCGDLLIETKYYKFINKHTPKVIDELNNKAEYGYLHCIVIPEDLYYEIDKLKFFNKDNESEDEDGIIVNQDYKNNQRLKMFKKFCDYIEYNK